MAFGGHALVHELHPTWHLNGSTTVALPSEVDSKTPNEQNL
jgi:hypothetical protein